MTRMLDKLPPPTGFQTGSQGLGDTSITRQDIEAAIGKLGKNKPMYSKISANHRTMAYFMHTLGVLETTGPIPTMLWSIKLEYNPLGRDGMIILYKKSKKNKLDIYPDEQIARIYKIVIPKNFVCEQTNSES